MSANVQLNRPSSIYLFGLTMRTWLKRYQARRALKRLDRDILHRLGISKADVRKESSKPFWVA